MSEEIEHEQSGNGRGQEILIRRLGPGDVDSVWEIEKLSFKAPWSRDSYQRELTENTLARYLGCFLQDKLIAFAGFWLILDECHISNVAVHPLYRGKGVGELLVRNLLNCCQAENGRWATLELRVSNTVAHDLYKKLGFRDLGKRKAYYEDGEDATIMWATLPD